MSAPDETKVFSTLIGDIYDASLDPALWPDVLKNSAQLSVRRRRGIRVVHERCNKEGS